jgi:ankyrin repeat protein
MPRIAATLLSHGARIEARSLGGRSPLDEAIYSGNHEVVLLLLNALPRAAQQAPREQIASYAALSDASLRYELLARSASLPPITRRAAVVDAAPPNRPSAGSPTCKATGDWDATAAGEPSVQHIPSPNSELAATPAAGGVDQRTSDLSEEEYYREYFLKGRPLLIRNAVSLEERCALAASNPEVRDAAAGQQFYCGATAYPELTGRKSCGRFNFLELRSNPRCHDAHRTRPLCNWKLSKMKARLSQ